jgi:hypothetical protein
MRRLVRSLVPVAVLAAAVASGPMAAASVSTTGTAAASRPAVEDCGSGPALIRPASLILTCADDGELATHLAWTSWTAAKATATGSVTWRVCTALCADSRRRDSVSADYTLTDPVTVAGKGILFTRLEMHVTGPTPRGFLRNLAFYEAPAAAAAPPVSAPPVSGRHGVQAAPSGSLGYGAIEGYWLYAGGPDGSSGGYTDAQIAAAITGAESSFYPGKIQPDVDYCDAAPDRAGWGLWQITCGNSVPQYGTDFQVLDPWNNAEEAVYDCDQDMDAGYNCFDPWSTYTAGTYENFLQTTGPDVSISDPGEYVQVNSTPPGTPSSPGPDPGSTYGPPLPSGQLQYCTDGYCLNAWNGGPYVNTYTSGVANNDFLAFLNSDTGYENIEYTGNGTYSDECVSDYGNSSGDARAGLDGYCQADQIAWGANFQLESCGNGEDAFYNVHWGGWLGPASLGDDAGFYLNKPTEYCFTVLGPG